MVRLKGITWDHSRGYDPLIATSQSFSKIRPDIEIEWKKRSLKEFGDYPIEELVKEYDLILIDHPFMGEAYRKNLLVDLNQHISKDFLEVQKMESVGKSYESYLYNARLQALPVDSTALVSVARTEEIKRLGLLIPKTFDEIFELSKNLPKNQFMAIPLCPTDIWCLFLTLCAQIGGKNFFDISKGIPEKIGEIVLNKIFELKEGSHPDSLNMNPISILDRMTEDDSIIYSPFLFGYTNYSRLGWRKEIVEFFDAPIIEGAEVSTLLGGVGISIASNSKNISDAVEYVKYVTTPKIQEGIYVQENGQPAQLTAWKSERNNDLTNNFFENTLKTMENAYMRPRIPAWNDFQEASSSIIHKGISENRKYIEIISEVNDIFKSICLL